MAAGYDEPRTRVREEGRPLAKTCTFLSYDSVSQIAGLPHLAHVNDTVPDENAEDAGDE